MITAARKTWFVLAPKLSLHAWGFPKSMSTRIFSKKIPYFTHKPEGRASPSTKNQDLQKYEHDLGYVYESLKV